MSNDNKAPWEGLDPITILSKVPSSFGTFYDLDGSALVLHWEFGDGKSERVVIPHHAIPMVCRLLLNGAKELAARRGEPWPEGD